MTQFDEFAAALLDALAERGHRAGPNEAWSHHNYTDLERELEESGTQRLRAVLRDRWTGFAEGEPPTVFITEGGVRVGKMREYHPGEDPLAAAQRQVSGMTDVGAPSARIRTGPARQHLTWLGAGFVVGFASRSCSRTSCSCPETSTTASTSGRCSRSSGCGHGRPGNAST